MKRNSDGTINPGGFYIDPLTQHMLDITDHERAEWRERKRSEKEISQCELTPTQEATGCFTALVDTSTPVLQ